MTDNQLARLREITELLAAASRDVDTMLWYAERDAESKGFQWLMAGAQRAAEATRRLKTLVDERTDGWRMLDEPKFDDECPVHAIYHRNDEPCPHCAESREQLPAAVRTAR